MEASSPCHGVPSDLGVPRAADLVIYPSLDLLHGHVVDLEGGDPNRVRQERPSPEQEARNFHAAGATWMNVVDLDAAFGQRNQWPHLARLLDGRLRIQFGGGVRSMTQVQQLLDLGVERVTVGTQAILNPLWARELALIFSGRIVLALDARGRDLVVHGWTQETGKDIVETAKSLADSRLAAFLYTDVSGRPDPGIVGEIRLAAPRIPLLVGGNLGLDDLAWLREAGVAGAVLGLGAYTGLDLAQALQEYPPPPARPMVQVLRAREELESPEASDSDEEGDAPDADGSDGTDEA